MVLFLLISLCSHCLKIIQICKIWGFPGGFSNKEPASKAGHTGGPGSIPGLGRSPGEGNGNPLQYSCLENPMDRGAWWLHTVAKSWTHLRNSVGMHANYDCFPIPSSILIQGKNKSAFFHSQVSKTVKKYQ